MTPNPHLRFYKCLKTFILESKGRTLHLLKQGAKNVVKGRKRRRFEVFGFETAQETQIQEHQQTMTKRDETMFEDATDKIKKSKRNKTLVDPFGYTSHK